jgi:hypothetical protein
MNIAMMTSWDCPCGIAKYSQKLVHAYEKQFTEDRLAIFANKIETDDARVFPETFVVKWWDEGEAFVDIGRINALIQSLQIDLLHIQFQGTFFMMPELETLIERVDVPVVVTFHDDCQLPTKFGYHRAIVHRREHLTLFPPAVLMPHPYDVFKPTVFTHGLGRNMADLIERVCEELQINFECHDSKRDGWLSEDMLQLKMQNADAIVCWYSDMASTRDKHPRVPVAGSGAVRTAISSFRPVFINDCRWFDDIPNDVVHRFSGPEGLKLALWETLNLEEIRVNSYDNFAYHHYGLYQEILNG